MKVQTACFWKEVRVTMNKYEAVVIASQEARRINELTGKVEKESVIKPAVIALKRLADERLKIKVEKEKEG